MSEQTTNFGLILPDGNDFYDVEVFNENARILDEETAKRVVKNPDIVGGTKPKVSYDEKGLIIGGEDLTPDDIPNIHVSKVEGRPPIVYVNGVPIYGCRFFDIDDSGNAVLREDGKGDYLLTVLENGDVILRDTVTKAADEVPYSNDNYPECKDVSAAIDMILSRMDYISPEIESFAVAPSTLEYEIGTTITNLVFSWTINKNVLSISLNGTEIPADSRQTAYTTAFSENKQFTLSVNDGANTDTASKTITFLPSVYFGGSAEPDSYTGNFILSLENRQLKSSRGGRYTIEAAQNDYAYICMPTRFGVPTVTIGGFTTELETASQINLTNASGHTEQYNVFKTSQKGLGSVTLVVS